MSTYFAILTKIGEAKLANAINLGTTLQLKQMGVGDGNGVVPTPDREQKSLVHEVRRADINQLAGDPTNTSQITVEQVLPENVGGFWIREIGVYDAAGDLCAVANCPPSYKPNLSEGSGRTQVVRVVLIVASSTAGLELKIDPSVVLATRGYVEIYAAPKNHTHAVSEILPGGLVQQVLRKKSNAAGDVEWADPTQGVQINVNTREEPQILAAGQTVVDLLKVTTNGMALFIGGARVEVGQDYDINSQTRFTLKRAYPKNMRILIAQNEVAGSVVNPLDASKNLSDVQNAAAARKNIKASVALTGTPQKWPTLDCPDFAVVRDGSALPRLVYPELFTVLCPFRVGTITQNAAGAVVTGLSRTKDMWVGMPVEHAALPAGATVKSIDSAAQVTLSVNSTSAVASASIQLFFHGYGNGGNAATFGVMDDRGLFDRALDSGERGYEKSTITGTTNATTAVTGIASTRGAYIGQPVSGPGLQAGTTVAGITAAGVTLSLAATTAVANNQLIFSGGQVGTERFDTFQGHWHVSYIESQHGYSPGGTINDYLAGYPQNAAIGSIRDAIADATNGTPRTGPETRPRFRNWLPIIII